MQPGRAGETQARIRREGRVTAGNSSQMSDGAGAALLVSEKILKQFDLKPLARFLSYSVAGVPAAVMGIGPVEAIPRALKLAGVSQNDVDWIELNEAFAQALAVMRTLDLDPAKVNPLAPSPWAIRSAPPAPSAPPR